MPESFYASAQSRLTIPNDSAFLNLALEFVLGNARIMGFAEKAINDIQVAAEEAVSNVIKHAFGPGVRAEFDIICEHIPLGLKIRIRDKGLPFDPAAVPKYTPEDPEQSAAAGGLGFFLMHRFMDDISFEILGRDGKEVRMTKYLHRATAEGNGQPAERDNATGPEEELPAPRSIPFKVRRATADEAIEISRCAYDAYEYSYGHEHIYYPERLKQLIASGQIISAVAVTKEEPQRIMAHNALIFDAPGDKIAEMGMAFTKRQFQNQGCSTRLGFFLLKEALKRGVAGLLLDCTTTHIYSQKAAINGGCRECCILLGIDPQAQSWKHFSSQSQRVSNVIAYKSVPLAAGVQKLRGRKTLYPPPRHAGIIRAIYTNLKQKARFASAPKTETTQPAALSTIHVHTGKSFQQNATIEVRAYGADALEQVGRTLRRLCLDKLEVVYLLLDLEDPLTAKYCADFEELGFFFAGIIPGADKHDRLELQYLNNVAINYSEIALYSDFAKELLAYIKERDPIQKTL